MRQKQLYAAPATEVLELRLEGNLLSGSPTVPTSVTFSTDSAYDGNDDW